MRRIFVIAVRVFPVTGWLMIGACGITSRQFSDFMASTTIRVGVQSVFSVIESVALDILGTA